jgi:hypothetical protein
MAIRLSSVDIVFRYRAGSREATVTQGEVQAALADMSNSKCQGRGGESLPQGEVVPLGRHAWVQDSVLL